ncbi:MAG: DUF3429 domain-containing protein [Gammaproteobacteria bacterium]|nr:DUF3429 domain-containing protein [Gammaproteobacteria bacterium]
MLNLSSIPTPARVFGLAGLIPFFAGAFLCWITPTDSTFSTLPTGPVVLLTYGAVILSFLGGIRWGVAMQHDAMINSWPVVAWAMVPSLLGWFALLIGAALGLVMLAFGFAMQFFVDYRSTHQGVTPAWFLSLRVVLTAGAIASLIVGWLAI